MMASRFGWVFLGVLLVLACQESLFAQLSLQGGADIKKAFVQLSISSAPPGFIHDFDVEVDVSYLSDTAGSFIGRVQLVDMFGTVIGTSQKPLVSNGYNSSIGKYQYEETLVINGVSLTSVMYPVQVLPQVLDSTGASVLWTPTVDTAYNNASLCTEWSFHQHYFFLQDPQANAPYCAIRRWGRTAVGPSSNFVVDAFFCAPVYSSPNWFDANTAQDISGVIYRRMSYGSATGTFGFDIKLNSLTNPWSRSATSLCAHATNVYSFRATIDEETDSPPDTDISGSELIQYSPQWEAYDLPGVSLIPD